MEALLTGKARTARVMPVLQWMKLLWQWISEMKWNDGSWTYEGQTWIWPWRSRWQFYLNPTSMPKTALMKHDRTVSQTAEIFWSKVWLSYTCTDHNHDWSWSWWLIVMIKMTDRDDDADCCCSCCCCCCWW